MKKSLSTLILGAVFALLAACAPATPENVFRATVASTQSNAPIYTETPTLTPTDTLTPTRTLTPSQTPTSTLTRTPTPTLTFTPEPTQPLFTLTPASAIGAPPAATGRAELAPTAGWSCDDFPCADDIDGFMDRIQVPPGYQLEHAGRFPGQPMQITYGPDGRLYATVLENGTRSGAVYAMNADGTSERYSETLLSPVGLAFQPGTQALYVSGRTTPMQGGSLWRIGPGGGSAEPILTDLPCCFQVLNSQPNGLTFGPDGLLYLGVSALTDQDEPPPGRSSSAPPLVPNEASVLRIDPHTRTVEVFASGIRSPYDVAFDSSGRLFATDNGLLAGPGDRLLEVTAGAHYGWPYWRGRGCDVCPSKPGSVTIVPDLLPLPSFTLPRGLVVYQGTQFPVNMYDSLFVTFWNGTEGSQRVVRIDPDALPTTPEDLAIYAPQPFVTGLIRPVDVAVAPDGSLVVADFIYGHVWRVVYTG